MTFAPPSSRERDASPAGHPPRCPAGHLSLYDLADLALDHMGGLFPAALCLPAALLLAMADMTLAFGVLALGLGFAVAEIRERYWTEREAGFAELEMPALVREIAEAVA